MMQPEARKVKNLLTAKAPRRRGYAEKSSDSSCIPGAAQDVFETVDFPIKHF